MIRVLGEPLGHGAVPAVHGHDGGQLDEGGAQRGHGGLPVALLTAAVGVVQQEEPVVVPAALVRDRLAAGRPVAAAVAALVEHGGHEPPDDPAAVHDDQHRHRGHGRQRGQERDGA